MSANGQNTKVASSHGAFEQSGMAGIDPEDVLANAEVLTLILCYHISPRFRDPTTALKATKIRRREGGFLQEEAGALADNLEREAAIIAADAEASNGVIHVIDKVISVPIKLHPVTSIMIVTSNPGFQQLHDKSPNCQRRTALPAARRSAAPRQASGLSDTDI